MMVRGAWLILLFFAGCGTSVYPYRVMNDDCSCEIFHVMDEKASVAFSFSAAYSIDGVMNTRIAVSILNRNADTLDLSVSYVKIASRNIPYRYNDKFLPVTISNVPPGKEHTMILEGVVENMGRTDPWLAIAGEELTVTLKGIRIQGKEIPTQQVRFVPHNPKLSLQP